MERNNSRFETGKTYNTPKGNITITKRTRCYITFTGTEDGERIAGKKKIRNGLFGYAECVMFYHKKTRGALFCFAR